MRRLFCLLCIFLTLPAQARPQVIVVIADHLTLADVTQPGLPAIARMREGGQMCLLSPGLAQGRDPIANVYATLGAGDAIHAGNVSEGLMGRTLAAAHIRTALLGNGDGDDTGLYRPALHMLPAPDFTPSADGTISDLAFPGGRRINPPALWALTQSVLRTCDLVVVHDGDFARIERERAHLLPSAYFLHRTRALRSLDKFIALAVPPTEAPQGLFVWLLSPTAPLRPDGTWDSLALLLRGGRDVQFLPFAPFQIAHRDRDWDSEAHPVAQSETTQTWGLAAVRDVAPALLTTLGVALPVQMTGAPITGSPVVPDQEALPRLARLDRMTRLNQQAQNPFFWTLGFTGAGWLLTTIGLTLSSTLAQRPRLRRIALYGLRALTAVPLALLLAPLTNPNTLNVYLAAMLGITLTLALLPMPAIILSLTALVLLGDGLTGTALVSQSLLSAYALSGIRFYGIGNEYMGVLLAGILALSSLPILQKRRGAGALLLFALSIFVLSFPAFGAKAGGAVTATATFLVAWRGLRGKSVTGKHVAAGIAIGFALVFVWAVIGHALALRRTHIDMAAQALTGGRFGYIAGVAARKVGLALRVTSHPGTLMGLLAIVLVGGAARLALRRPVTGYLVRHPRFAAIWRAGLWGCAVAILFNDSGIVAAILLILCLGLTLLHGAVAKGAGA